ncbi:unnamed protein product [Phaeothamnion confervicola]
MNGEKWTVRAKQTVPQASFFRRRAPSFLAATSTISLILDGAMIAATVFPVNVDFDSAAATVAAAAAHPSPAAVARQCYPDTAAAGPAAVRRRCWPLQLASAVGLLRLLPPLLVAAARRRMQLLRKAEDEDVWYFKGKNKSGVCFAATGSLVIVGAYQGDEHMAGCNGAVEALAKYLKDSGY